MRLPVAKAAGCRFIAKMQLQAEVPFEDTYVPIGGVTFWVHLTNPSRLRIWLVGQGLPQRPKPADQFEERFGGDRSIVRASPALPRLKVGQVAFIEGKLLEPGPGPIAVEFTSGTFREVVLTQADDKGRFQVRYQSMKPGVWNAQAFFADDHVREAATSNTISYQIPKRRFFVR